MSVPHPFHEFPKHLYAAGPVTDGKGKEHPSAVQVHNAADEAMYRALGYGDDYVPQEYPKALHKKVMGKNPVTNQPEQQIVSVAASNAAEVKEFQRKGWVTADQM